MAKSPEQLYSELCAKRGGADRDLVPRLLEACGFVKRPTGGGSSEVWLREADGPTWTWHRPHPRKTLGNGLYRKFRQFLDEEGLIDHSHD